MRKINRLLAFLLAFTVVITTFSSDFTTAKVFATEAEAVVESEDKINTVEKEKVETPEVVEEPAEEAAEEPAAEPATGEEAGDDEKGEEVEEDASETKTDADDATEEELEEVEEVEEVAEEVLEVEEEDKEEAKKESDENETISLKEEEDGILITVSFKKGVLPEDAELIVSRVDSDKEDDIQALLDEETSDDVEVQETISFDINIKSESEGEGDNKYVQPDGDVEVTFESVDAAASEDISMEVYHVNDSVTEAESVSDVVKDGTEISFDAEHFSIYSIILVTKQGDEEGYEIKIRAYDSKGKEIGRDKYVETILISDGYYLQTTPKLASPVISGYKYNYAKYNNEKITEFYINKSYKLIVQTEREKYVYDDRIIDFYYSDDLGKHNGNHVDLRLTNSQNQEISTKNAYVWVGKGPKGQATRYSFTKIQDEGSTKELHKDISVSTDDTIYFEIVLNGKSYTTQASKDLNEEAYERCKRDHGGANQGFDYLLDFSKDFEIAADVIYHSNFGDDKTYDAEVTDKNTTEITHNVLSYDATKLPKPDGCTFAGWSESASSTTTVKSVKVKDGAKKHLYAVWKCNVVFRDYEDNTLNYEVNNNYKTVSVFKGYKVAQNEMPKDPTKGIQFEFEGWFVENEQGKLVAFERDKYVVTKNTNVYAKWKNRLTTYTVITKFEKTDGNYTETQVVKQNAVIGSKVDPKDERPTNVDVEKYDLDTTNSTTKMVEILADGKTKIYNVYKLKPASYTVQYFYQDENWKYKDKADYEVSRSGKITGKAEVTSTDEKPTKNGYEFDKQNSDNKLKIDSLDKDAKKNVLKVYFRHIKYSVKYEYKTPKDRELAKTIPQEEKNHYLGETVTANEKDVPKPEGYTFSGWFAKSGLDMTGKITTFSMPDKNVVLQGTFKPNDDTPYVVEHYTENLPGSKEQWKLEKTESLFGTTDETIKYGATGHYVERIFDGFTFAPSKTKFFNDKTELKSHDKKVILSNGKLIIRLYYTRNKYKVQYQFTDQEAPYGRSPLPVDNNEYYYEQIVQLADDATAPGHTFSGWTPYEMKTGIPRPVIAGEDARPAEGGIGTAIGQIIYSVIELIKGDDGNVAEPKSFVMPASNVLVKGGFEKTPYQIKLKINGKVGDDAIKTILPYNGEIQTADMDFDVVVTIVKTGEDGQPVETQLTAFNTTSDGLDVLMASANKVMSLGTLTVYAYDPSTDVSFDSGDLPYNGDEQGVENSTVTKEITVDDITYVVKVALAGGKGKDVDKYDVTVDSISITNKADGRDMSDIFVTDLEVGQIVGYLQVTPAPVTVKAPTGLYKYVNAKDPEKFTPSYEVSLPEGTSDEIKAEVKSEAIETIGAVVDRQPGERVGKYVLMVNEHETEFTEEEPIGNFLVTYVPGIFEIRNRPSSNEDNPDEPTTVEDTPVAAAPAPAVLGAQRDLPVEQPAVLGARRSGTSDTSILGSIITIIVAAAIAFSMIFIKRKKREEE